MSAPTVTAQGRVYVGTLSGKLYSLSAGGRVSWSRRLTGDVEGSVAVSQAGNLYIGSGLPGLRGSLMAFTAGGRRLWTFQTPDTVFTTPATGADATIYFGSDDTYVYALRSNGRLKWRYQTGQAVDSSPAIAPDGTLYVGSDDGSVYAFAGLQAASANSRPAGFTPASKVSGHAGLIAPGALAVGPKGSLFVADLLRYGVVELAANGKSLGVLGGRGTGPGHFQVLTGVAVDDHGRVFVADGVNGDVQEFVPRGRSYRFQRSFGSWRVGKINRHLVQPLALVVARDGSRVYVGDARYGVIAFTKSGRYLGAWSPGPQYVIHSLTVAPNGSMYTTFGGPLHAQASYRISPDLKTRQNLGFADPAGAPYLVLDSALNFYGLSPAPSFDVTKYQPVTGGFQELTFFSTASGFQYGLAINAANQVFVPNFAESSRPRGAVSTLLARPSDGRVERLPTHRGPARRLDSPPKSDPATECGACS